MWDTCWGRESGSGRSCGGSHTSWFLPVWSPDRETAAAAGFGEGSPRRGEVPCVPDQGCRPLGIASISTEDRNFLPPTLTGLWLNGSSSFETRIGLVQGYPESHCLDSEHGGGGGRGSGGRRGAKAKAGGVSDWGPLDPRRAFARAPTCRIMGAGFAIARRMGRTSASAPRCLRLLSPTMDTVCLW